MLVPRQYWKPFCETGAVPSRLWISTWAQVKKSNSCQYLKKTEYRASCKQGAKPALDSWYQTEARRGNGIVQFQSWDHVSGKNRLQSNASTEPVQISVLAWHRSPVPRQYWWTTSSQVIFRSCAGVRPCLFQFRTSTENPFAELARFQAGCEFPTGPGWKSRIHASI